MHQSIKYWIITLSLKFYMYIHCKSQNKTSLTQAILLQECCQTLLLILLVILCLPLCKIFAGDPFVLVLPLQVCTVERRVHLYPHIRTVCTVPASWHSFTYRSLAIIAHLVLAVRTSDDFVQGRVMNEACTTLSLIEKWCRVKWGTHFASSVSTVQCSGVLTMCMGFQ